MGQSVVTYLSRRLWNFAITGLLAVALVSVTVVYDISLRDPSFLTGWLLAGGIAFLAIYNTRKKLPFLPLGRSAVWLQAHIYVGLLVVLVFLLHTSFAVPNGPVEVSLWVLFVAVAGSGLIGIALSRALARFLHLRGERVIFERIPVFRARLAEEVRDLAQKSVSDIASTTIAQYYATRLHDYFRGPQHFFAHLRRSEDPLLRMQREIKSLERYLDERGKDILAEIESRVVAKNNLDFQYALQLVLKLWLFVHIPLTYGLILIAVVHMVLVFAFSAGTL